MSVIPLFLISLLLPMGFLARRITRPVLSNVLTWLGLLCLGLGSSFFVFALLREVALLATQGFHGLWPSKSAVAPLAGFRTDTALLVPVMGLLVTLRILQCPTDCGGGQRRCANCQPACRLAWISDRTDQ